MSIAVCIANLKLRDITHSAMTPIIAGISLMVTTVLLLVVYLAKNNPSALGFSLAAYGTVGSLFAVFRHFKPVRSPGATDTDSGRVGVE